LRAFAAKQNFMDELEKISPHYCPISAQNKQNLIDFTLKYWNIKLEDVITYEEFKGDQTYSDTLVFSELFEKYKDYLFKKLPKSCEIDTSLRSFMYYENCKTKGDVIDYLFHKIIVQEKNESARLLMGIDKNLDYVMLNAPAIDEFFYFKNLLGNSFKKIREYPADYMQGNCNYFSRLVNYSKLDEIKIRVDNNAKLVKNLSPRQFIELIRDLEFQSGFYPSHTVEIKNQSGKLNNY